MEYTTIKENQIVEIIHDKGIKYKILKVHLNAVLLTPVDPSKSDGVINFWEPIPNLINFEKE